MNLSTLKLCNGGPVTDIVQGLRKFEGRKLKERQIAYITREVVDVSELYQND